MTDAPSIDGDDDFEADTVGNPFSFKDPEEGSLHRRFLEAINLMGAAGPDAEDRYRAAIERLTNESEEVIEIVRKEYDYLPEENYLDRWSLVQLLVELAEPASLDLLDEILSSEIPSERSQDPHHFSTVGEEVMIRTTAVEAVTRIASRDNEEALELLLEHTHHDDFSVKRACVQGYLAHGGDDATQVLKEELPRDDHDLLEIERVDVREVPQADGHDYLKTEVADVPPAEPPEDRTEEETLNQLDPRRFGESVRDFGMHPDFDVTDLEGPRRERHDNEDGDSEDTNEPRD